MASAAQLCRWSTPPHVGKEAETAWQPTYLPLFLKKKRGRERKKRKHTSINKCDHVQRGGPPHLSWIQAAQAYDLLLHPYPSPSILVPPGSLILTAVLQQTSRNPGEHAWPQDSERLRTRARSALREWWRNQAAAGVRQWLPQQQQRTQGQEPVQTGGREPDPNWHPLLGRVANLRQRVRHSAVRPAMCSCAAIFYTSPQALIYW